MFSTTEKPKKIKFDYLYGLNSCLASLQANRRIFSKLYLNISEKNEQSENPIIQEANDSMQSLENPQHPYSDSNNRVEQMTR